jgi:cytochrome oxidase Cu insertion factor (SCO1/SenC/PrrC family)
MRGGALAALLAAVALTAAAHEPPPAPPPLFEPPAVGSYELPVIQRVSEHWLLAADGSRAPLLGIGGDEVALVAFVYTRCGDACPLALATLQRLDRALAARPALGARTRLVSVSFDPAYDTPARMSELRGHMRPKGRWAFLTARDGAALAPVLSDFGQSFVQIPDAGGDPSGLLGHVLKVYLVDGRGDVRNIYSTEYLYPELLLNDVATVLGTAAEDAP